MELEYRVTVARRRQGQSSTNCVLHIYPSPRPRGSPQPPHRHSPHAPKARLKGPLRASRAPARRCDVPRFPNAGSGRHSRCSAAQLFECFYYGPEWPGIRRSCPGGATRASKSPERLPRFPTRRDRRQRRGIHLQVICPQTRPSGVAIAGSGLAISFAARGAGTGATGPRRCVPSWPAHARLDAVLPIASARALPPALSDVTGVFSFHGTTLPLGNVHARRVDQLTKRFLTESAKINIREAVEARHRASPRPAPRPALTNVQHTMQRHPDERAAHHTPRRYHPAESLHRRCALGELHRVCVPRGIADGTRHAGRPDRDLARRGGGPG